MDIIYKSLKLKQNMGYDIWAQLQRAKDAVVIAGAPEYKCRVYLLVEADPKELNSRLLRAQSTVRQALGYPTLHPTPEELYQDIDFELDRALKQDERFQYEMDRTLLSALKLPENNSD